MSCSHRSTNRARRGALSVKWDKNVFLKERDLKLAEIEAYRENGLNAIEIQRSERSYCVSQSARLYTTAGSFR